MKGKYNNIPKRALGGALSGAGGGAASGAAAGAKFGPWGAVIGGVAGGIFGGVSGNAEEEAMLEQQRIQRERENRMTELARSKADKANLRAYDIFGTPDFGFYKQGGPIVDAEYEVEGDEIVQGADVRLEGQQDLASDLTKVVGPSHESGGVEGKGGERVFSDRIPVSSIIREVLPTLGIGKVEGNTYAEVAENISRKKGKFEEKVASNFKPAIKTAEKMLGRVDNSLDLLFDLQESENMKTNTKKYATGGYLPYNRVDQAFDPYAVSLKDDPLFITPTSVASTNDASSNSNRNAGSFGAGALDFLSDNIGQLANLGNYLGNARDLRRMRTDVNRTLVNAPTYNYRNRSGAQQRELGRMSRQAVNSLGTSSRTVNDSNIGALTSRAMDASNRIAMYENERRDNYDRNYADTILGVEAQNASIINQGNDLSRDLYNNRLALGQNNRTAFVQGILGNLAVQNQRSNDRNRMSLSYLFNNENGALDRQANKLGLTSAELMKRLSYGRSILAK